MPNPLGEPAGVKGHRALEALEGLPASIANGLELELSSGSIASAERFSAGIVQGRKGEGTEGARPLLSAPHFRSSVNQARTLSPARLEVARSENRIAASRPRHDAPDP